MNVIKFVRGHRGTANLIRRAAQIARRFGHSPRKMGARFERFMDLLNEFDVRPTFPITALPLSRNAAFAHRLLARDAELAVHAWSHIDLAALGYEEQKAHMGRAVQVFRQHGVPFSGFRAPYLHWNEDTMRVVEDYHYRYSSNQTVWWDVIDADGLTAEQREGLRRGIAFYRPVPAAQMRSLPFRRRGFVEIPVSLPDDEIPLDRMYIHDAEFLAAMWRDILTATYQRGELFTLQLHPERIDFFAGALRGLLGTARAMKPGVWIATLDEVAGWWVNKSHNRIEFVREEGGHRATARVCDGTTLLLRQDGVDRGIEPGSFFVPGERRPCVGVSPGAGRGVIQALADLGYVVEVGELPEDFAVHVGTPAGDDYEAIEACRRAVSACRGPLVRFGTWPRGNHSALVVSGDIDALTIWDFVHRFRGE